MNCINERGDILTEENRPVIEIAGCLKIKIC